MRQLAFPLMILMAMATPVMAQPSGGGRGGDLASRPTPVIISTITTDQFVDEVEAIGTLRANETVTLAATVTETITAINFEDGQRVKKGDILVEMTNAEEKANLDQQRALVNEASRQLERTRDLARNGAASKTTLDERQRQYSAARAGMAALQSRLEDHIIVAPFDGIVGLRNLSVGALVQPGTTITTLDDDSVMKLDFAIPSVFMTTLTPGISIVAKADGFEEKFSGTVSSINSQIDPATRAVMVRAIIPNPEGLLKPGLLMKVSLLKNPREVVIVPENAIIPEGRKHFVLVADEAQTPPVAERREIQVGARRPGAAEVLSGLKAGEKVIVHGTMMARPGALLSITAEQKPGEALSDILKTLAAEKQKAAGNPQKGGD
jgi:membrane fusion protein (multidrug efflux system)